MIAGRLGGRRLRAPRGRDLRPTADRVREALFSILGEDVREARVLDLYAGTGALAIEAISRGAREATCVERDRSALEALERNADELGLGGRLRVAREDALAFCRGLAGAEAAYDVVFCDPPYRTSPAPLGSALIDAGWWTTVVALEHAADVEPPPAPAGLAADTRRWGDTAITFYRRETAESGRR